MKGKLRSFPSIVIDLGSEKCIVCVVGGRIQVETMSMLMSMVDGDGENDDLVCKANNRFTRVHEQQHVLTITTISRYIDFISEVEFV
jgi:hypothetical protein